MVVGQIRKRISIAAVRAQCHTLLGRLEVKGPGTAAAAGRRRRSVGGDEKDMLFCSAKDKAETWPGKALLNFNSHILFSSISTNNASIANH